MNLEDNQQLNWRKILNKFNIEEKLSFKLKKINEEF